MAVVENRQNLVGEIGLSELAGADIDGEREVGRFDHVCPSA